MRTNQEHNCSTPVDMGTCSLPRINTGHGRTWWDHIAVRRGSADAVPTHSPFIVFTQQRIDRLASLLLQAIAEALPCKHQPPPTLRQETVIWICSIATGARQTTCRSVRSCLLYTSDAADE